MSNLIILTEKLKGGDHLRVLVVNPDRAAYAMEAVKSPGPLDVERERMLVRATLGGWCTLRVSTTG